MPKGGLNVSNPVMKDFLRYFYQHALFPELQCQTKKSSIKAIHLEKIFIAKFNHKKVLKKTT